MLKDLHSKAKGLCSATVRGRRQLSEARAIGFEEVVRSRDKRERVDSKKAARAAAREERKLGTAKN